MIWPNGRPHWHQLVDGRVNTYKRLVIILFLGGKMTYMVNDASHEFLGDISTFVMVVFYDVNKHTTVYIFSFWCALFVGQLSL